MKTRTIKKLPLIIGAIVLVVIVLAVAGAKAASKAGVLVTTVRAVRGEVQETVSTSGTVEAENVKVIYAPASGKLGKVSVAAGDAVKKGDLLIGYDLNSLEKNFHQAVLQQEKTTASYEGMTADNNKNQAKLSEANTNLTVLKQQIADNEAYLKKLQNELSESQRGTANALAKDYYDLSEESRQLPEEIAQLEGEIAQLTAEKAQLEAAGGGSDAGALEAIVNRITEKESLLAEKQKRLSDIPSELSHNSYLSQTAGSSDYLAELNREIIEVQERLNNYRTYKAEMESQKAGSEPAVMDDYDRTAREADRELADLSYEEAERVYTVAKEGIIAAFDGIVTSVTAIEGSTVAESMQLLTLESSEEVKVTFTATKHNLEKLELGQKAELKIFGKIYHGTVSKINRMASPNSSGTPMVGVEIHIDDPDEKIILGMDAKITVFTHSVQNELLIPSEAVNADKEGDFLYVVENGVVVRRPVECGISSDDKTVILEGITDKDEVILSALGSLEEGMKVTVMPEM